MTAPFISSADLSAYLRDDNPDTNLTAIALDAGCERVRGYCNQDLGTASVVDEWQDGSGTGLLFLPVMGVTAVPTVMTYLDRTDTAPATLTLNTHYVLKGKTGVLMRIDGEVFPQGGQNIKVSYDYGVATVPADARLVALQVAARIYAVGQAVSESVGGISVNYVEGAGNLTRDEKDTIRRYRVD